MCSELLTNEYLTCEKKNQGVLVRIVKGFYEHSDWLRSVREIVLRRIELCKRHVCKRDN